MPRPTDSEIENAKRILRADYAYDCDDVVQDAISEIKSGNITDDESLREYVAQSVDGTQRVIYTGEAMLGLWASSNMDALCTELGGEGAADQDGVNYSALMCFAMIEDVMADLDSEGYGYGGENWPQECEECGYLPSPDTQENHIDWAASHVEDGCSLAAEEAAA